MIVSSDTGIFRDQERACFFSYHFNQLIENEVDLHRVYGDFEQFKNAQHQHRVACLQMPYPVRPEFQDTIDQVYDVCDRVIILCSELHDRTVDIILNNDREKITYFICGTFNFQLKNAQVERFLDWFTTTVHFYKEVGTDVLDRLTPYMNKNSNFDVLLGRKKMHRDFVYQYLEANNLIDKNIVTYINDHSIRFSGLERDKWIWEIDGVSGADDAEWTVDMVSYYGHRMSLSQIIPIDIYNRTAFSLVAETNYSNHYSFYTEKTIKPILGRRLFIAIAGQHHLRNLRELGFKTFDGIIDESYDNIEDPRQRFAAAMEQFRLLCDQYHQYHERIMPEIQAITDHNYQVLMETDWYDQYFRKPFERCLTFR